MLSKVPAGPALVRGGVVGVFGAGLGAAIACGGRTVSDGVPPTTDAPTTTPDEDAGHDASVDSGHDSDTFSLLQDSGYVTGLYDATGRQAADALADGASDGHIFEPPCGKRAPPHR